MVQLQPAKDRRNVEVRRDRMASIGAGILYLELELAHAGVEEATAAPGRDVNHHNLAWVVRTLVVGRLVPSGLG
jgi:hypothetical protein